MERLQPTPDQVGPRKTEGTSGDPRIDAAMQLLESGVDKLIDSDEFRNFLEFSAKFPSYSFNNLMLIWAQKPDATKVMGYGSKDGKTGWKSVGRQVRAGEKAIKIFAPMVRKETDLQTGDRVDVVRGFKLVNVFDVSSTDGEPIPERPRPQDLLTSSEVGRLTYDYNEQWLSQNNIPVIREAVPGSSSAKGSYYPGEKPRIYVRPDLADDMAAKTLLHETGHWVGDHRLHQPREEVEAVAEGAAFVAANRFGLDTESYSTTYISAWCQDKELFKSKLGEIQQVSKVMITGIEKLMYPNGEMQGAQPL